MTNRTNRALLAILLSVLALGSVSNAAADDLAKASQNPVDFKVHAFANVVHPDAGPDWTVMGAVKFLFPK